MPILQIYYNFTDFGIILNSNQTTNYIYLNIISILFYWKHTQTHILRIWWVHITPDVTRHCFLVGLREEGQERMEGRWIGGDNDRKNKHMNK